MVTDCARRDGWFRVEDRDHHYLEWGDPAAPPLVMLHGGNSSARGTWSKTATDFADGYHVLAPDQRGHGESAWSPAGAYRISDYVSDFASFVRQMGLPRFPLVAHSLGGLVAIAFAARHPEAVERLVLVDSLPRPMDAARRAEVAARPLAPESFATFDDVEDYLALTAPQRRRRSAPGYGVLQLPDGRWRLRTDSRGVRNSLAAEDPGRQRLWEDYRALAVPTLVIRGGASPIISADDAHRLAAEGPHARVVTYEAGTHWVHRDQPERFAADVRAFLAQGEPGAHG